MMEVGRLCVKIAGRDAGKKCVIVDIVDDTMVMIDGETRRRKCNIAHLEPLKDTVSVKKGASHAEVKTAFSKLGLKVLETKPKKAGARPRQIRTEEKRNMAEQADKKPAKKEKLVEPVKEEKPAEKTEKKE